MTIDHTHDANVVEFPVGRLETTAIPEPIPQVVERAVAVRVADTRFVLDSLTALNSGTNPDAEQRNLPAGLRGAMRLASIGIFGPPWAARPLPGPCMLQDPRIKAGINLDGTLYGPVVNAGLNRPFMLIASQNHGRNNDETWDKFWANLLGWRLDLQLTDRATTRSPTCKSSCPRSRGCSTSRPKPCRS